MLQNKNNLLNIGVLCWKDSNSLYFPAGKYVFINCNHQKEGFFHVNIAGEAFPVPTSTVPPGTVTSPPTEFTDFEQKTAEVLPGNVYGGPTPFATTDPKLKFCVRIKDLQTMITYYADVADYNNKIPQCNPVAYTVS